MQKATKHALHKQHEILENQMGWSFCGHFSVVHESFHSRFFNCLFLSPEQHEIKQLHKQHKITSLLINDYNLNKHTIEQHQTQLSIRKHHKLQTY
jgi:hypothetical protein